jgi:hypothetical protein
MFTGPGVDAYSREPFIPSGIVYSAIRVLLNIEPRSTQRKSSEIFFFPTTKPFRLEKNISQFNFQNNKGLQQESRFCDLLDNKILVQAIDSHPE